jgi:DNA-binding LacI/PurR family transcriptional regulator
MTVPDDVSVVGFDNTPLSGFAYINLTTIDQPADVGAAAVDMLIERVDDPSKPVATKLFKPELVVRGTTAPQDQANAAIRGA